MTIGCAKKGAHKRKGGRLFGAGGRVAASVRVGVHWGVQSVGDSLLNAGPARHRITRMAKHHSRHKPLPSRAVFARHVGRNTILAAAILAVSLGIGMAGYHGLEGLSWLDAFLNASMILAGMGPVGELHTPGGKFFAGCYALFSGVAFLTTAAIMLAPITRRFLHRMHLDIETQDEQ